jgi:osmotically-inducible protein OsmY
MERYNERETDRHSFEMNRDNDYNTGQHHGSYGSNYGEHARPYGEDYGEDLGWGNQSDDDRYRRHQHRHSNHFGGNEKREIGFSYQGRGYLGRYDDHRSQNENRSRGMGDLHYGNEGYHENYYPETYRSKESGYISQYNFGGEGRMHDHNNSSQRRYSDPWYDDRADRHGKRDWWHRTKDEVSSWFGDEQAEQRRNEDKGHRGRGPKNYRRSDGRIQDDIIERLTDDHQLDASDIDVTVENGEVVLSGRVDERRSKRRAEELAETVSGVVNVENRLRVAETNSVVW